MLWPWAWSSAWRSWADRKLSDASSAAARARFCRVERSWGPRRARSSTGLAVTAVVLVVVPVAVVGSVAVPVVDVVDVIAMGDGDMSAAVAVYVVVSGMFGVPVGGALVEVAVMSGVKVPVVDVVDVIAVRNGDMSAAIAV
jgi:hypothetical protein